MVIDFEIIFIARDGDVMDDIALKLCSVLLLHVTSIIKKPPLVTGLSDWLL